MNVNDLGDMQRYLVEEEAEKWREGAITRRDFIRRVTLLVGGAAAASGVLLSLGCDTSPQEAATATAVPGVPPTPSAAASQGGSKSPYHVPEDDPTIQVQMVEIPSSTPNVNLKGYLASGPARMSPARPAGVLVQHENRGLTEYVKDVVRRLAKAGYVAMCVDLLSRAGGTAAHPDEAERIGTLGQIPQDRLLTDLLDGVRYLKSRDDANPDRLGAIGFCFGGGMTWRLVTQSPDIKAAVPFYGPNPPLDDVPKIKAAVLGIYAGKDTRITGDVPKLEDALKKAGIVYEIKVYDGANHAFHNDTGANYDQQAATDAWKKTLEWLGSKL